MTHMSSQKVAESLADHGAPGEWTADTFRWAIRVGDPDHIKVSVSIGSLSAPWYEQVSVLRVRVHDAETEVVFETIAELVVYLHAIQTPVAVLVPEPLELNMEAIDAAEFWREP